MPNPPKKKDSDVPIVERNHALEGASWPVRKRWENLEALYRRSLLLAPCKPKPFAKSFSSFRAYEAWRKKQKNPWRR